MEGSRVHATVWHFARGPGTNSVPFYFTEGTDLWLLTCIAFSSRATEHGARQCSPVTPAPTSLLDSGSGHRRDAFYLHRIQLLMPCFPKTLGGLQQ